MTKLDSTLELFLLMERFTGLVPSQILGGGSNPNKVRFFLDELVTALVLERKAVIVFDLPLTLSFKRQPTCHDKGGACLATCASIGPKGRIDTGIEGTRLLWRWPKADLTNVQLLDLAFYAATVGEIGKNVEDLRAICRKPLEKVHDDTGEVYGRVRLSMDAAILLHAVKDNRRTSMDDVARLELLFGFGSGCHCCRFCVVVVDFVSLLCICLI